MDKHLWISLLAYCRDFGVGAVCNLSGMKRSPESSAPPEQEA